MTIFTIIIIGCDPRLSLWRHPSLRVISLDDCSSLSPIEILPDVVFLGTPVEWAMDGSFTTHRLQQDLERLHSLGYYHQIFLTAIMPIGISQKLHAHYSPFLLLPDQKIVGLNPTLWIDPILLRSLFVCLFPQILSTEQIFRLVQDAEMLCLIQICQEWINQSFQREIALFCSKNALLPSSTEKHDLLRQRKDMYPMLVYMIRQIEETRLDCPLLYSCLFRHKYIDIPI